MAKNSKQRHKLFFNQYFVDYWNYYILLIVYYYNFAWKDYCHGTIQGILDAVKVLSFALQQGRVAIHCHAGLGRTGVLLSCHLIHQRHIRAADAICYVRQKRENSVQTSGQIMFVNEFQKSLMAFSSVFSYR